jgi:hypothetical protein
MNAIRNSSKLVMVALILMIFTFSCKSKKKALEASNAAAEKARIEQEATARRQQEEEQKRKDAEEKAKADAASKANARYTILNQYFDSVAGSENVTSANNSISEALTMFASPETPVLIVISGTGDQKDYDRPTTIQAYLNYLKDQKKNINKIENLQFDSSGKIIEVELRKK